MDVVGFVILGTVTGVGGGTLRDLILGLAPVFWVHQPAYLVTGIGVSCAVFLLPQFTARGLRLLLWLDALGLALFAVTGAETAWSSGAKPLVCVAMGIVTASFGGILRDTIGNETPVVLSSEIYIVVAAAGASSYVLSLLLDVERDYALCGALVLGLALRLIAIRNHWSLPRAT